VSRIDDIPVEEDGKKGNVIPNVVRPKSVLPERIAFFLPGANRRGVEIL
jgi:hypothetical protein